MSTVLVTGIYPLDIGGSASHAAGLVGALAGARPRRGGGDAYRRPGNQTYRRDRPVPPPLAGPTRVAAAARAMARLHPDVIYGAAMHEAAALAALLATLLARSRPPEPRNGGPRHLLAVWVRRMEGRNGFDVLLGAMARTPGVELELVGERDRVAAAIERLGLGDRVRLRGSLRGGEVAAHLRATGMSWRSGTSGKRLRGWSE